jgi:hypothetical protein
MLEFACKCDDCEHEKALNSADLRAYLGEQVDLKNINQSPAGLSVKNAEARMSACCQDRAICC